MLKPPGIHPLTRQDMTAGMAEHVHMNGEGQLRGFASSFDGRSWNFSCLVFGASAGFFFGALCANASENSELISN